MIQSIRYRYSRAFALPLVMISSLVMMMVLLSGLTAMNSVNIGLRQQHEERLAKAASAAGIAMARACMAQNSSVVTWSNTKPLMPNTDCQGNETVSCPLSSTNAACFMVNHDNYRLLFKVGIAADTYGNLVNVDSRGTLHHIRQSDNLSVRETTSSLKLNTKSALVSKVGTAEYGQSLLSLN